MNSVEPVQGPANIVSYLDGNMSRKVNVILVLCLATFVAGGSIADDGVVPPTVRQIILKLTPKERAARAEFNRAMLAVRLELVEELKKAQAKALAANKLDDATAIAKLVEQAQGEADMYAGKSHRFRIAAKGVFQGVGTLPAGIYQVTATGSWRGSPKSDWNGPEGSKEMGRGGFEKMSLVANVDGRFVKVGSKGEIELQADGPVSFRAWDGDGRDEYGDNDGEIVVTLIRR